MFYVTRYLVLLILLILTTVGFGQLPHIDSLKRVITLQKEDSSKVNLLIELGTAYLSSDISEALNYGNQANQLATRINYGKGLGFAHNLLGLAYSKQANYPESNIQFKAGLEAFEQINYKNGIANVLSNLGTNYDEVGDPGNALEYYLQALRVAEEINDKMRIGTLLLNIGTMYETKEPKGNKGLGYYLRAIRLFKEIGDPIGEAIALANIGTIYFNHGDYDSALTIFNTFVELTGGDDLTYYGLMYLGKIYAEKGEINKAYEYHNKAIELSETLGMPLSIAEILLSKAELFRKQDNIMSAVENYREALKIAQEIRARLEIRTAYEGLAEAYAALGDFKNAYTYESLLTRMKDTIYNTAEDKKIQQMQFTFDMDKKEAELELKEATIKQQRLMNWAAGITGFLILLMAIGLFNRYKYVKKTNSIIKSERDRSKELLLNILPEETAKELETFGHAKTRYYENVTVLFTDFKGFSSIAGKLRPQELVAELNDYFIEFDEIVGRFGLEKIKTIGDAYMCAGGIPLPNDTHAFNAVEAALAMQAYMKKRYKELQDSGGQGWELRVGIHTGPIVAGVVGKKKYAYDIWGDTVNVASRMESNGEPGKVNISSSTYILIKDKYECHHRGKISAKNIGEVDMYFIEQEIVQHAISNGRNS